MGRAIAAAAVVGLVLGLGLGLATGCKDSPAQAREAAREARDHASQARDRAAQARDQAARKAEAARRGAGDLATRAADAARDAVGVARTVKTELDKVYKTDRDYDLDITRAGASADHAARLAAMPHVTVGDVTVGYEASTTTSLHGVSYARHFRATWRRGDEDVIVSYATQEKLDPIAFAALVEKLVPIVDRALD
jgi:hypothetical protein